MRELAHAPADPDLSRHGELRPGTTVDHFELLREIGRGGFGVVFEARDRRLGRQIAFKVVRPGRSSQVRLRGDQLQKEAEAVAQLTHPNIVTLYDVGACESGPYLIFELLRGETLAARMRRGPIAPSEALDVAIEIAWALEYAHRVGVVHRDLKPSNVMLCQQGMVKILDFGLAHMLGEADHRAGGSPQYMAPEQWRGQVQDARTDVFGAAAMLFESLSGRLPYRVSRAWSSALEAGARPAIDGGGIDPDVGQLLLRALSPDPEARPRDGHDWLVGLLQLRERRDAGGVLRRFPADRQAHQL
jgi:serine/threonine protein kinase